MERFAQDDENHHLVRHVNIPCVLPQVIFRDIGVYNTMLVEQMHIKIDELGKLALATQVNRMQYT